MFFASKLCAVLHVLRGGRDRGTVENDKQTRLPEYHTKPNFLSSTVGSALRQRALRVSVDHADHDTREGSPQQEVEAKHLALGL